MLKQMWIICTSCEGNGKVDNPAFSNGFTSSEWAEMQSDMDPGEETSAADRYMSGFYDVPCPTCKTSGKIQVPDVSAMTFAEKRVFVAARREQREAAEYARESAMERAMGA